MTNSKAILFETGLQEQAEIHKALAHPARLAILEYLAKTSTCITGDISNEFPLARTTINQHLTELKKVGLIKGDICGSKVKYCLDVEKIKSIKGLVSDYINSLVSNNQSNC